MTNVRTLSVLCFFALSACAPAFEMRTPDDFLELDRDHQELYGFDYRATTADGVVVAVRVEKNEGHGTLGFWTQAVRNRLRRAGGYAILEEEPARAASGEAGQLLRCGRDESSRPYTYWLAVFVDHDHVFLVEAGGRREAFEAARPRIEASLAGFRIR